MGRYDRWSRAEMPSGAELARINAGISQTMRDVVGRDCRTPANQLPVFDPPKPYEPPFDPFDRRPRRGWQEDKPAELPIKPGSFAESVVSAIIDQALPPAPPTLAGIKAQIRALSAAQRAQLLREIEASNDPRAAELKQLIECDYPRLD